VPMTPVPSRTRSFESSANTGKRSNMPPKLPPKMTANTTKANTQLLTAHFSQSPLCVTKEHAAIFASVLAIHLSTRSLPFLKSDPLVAPSSLIGSKAADHPAYCADQHIHSKRDGQHDGKANAKAEAEDEPSLICSPVVNSDRERLTARRRNIVYRQGGHTLDS